MFPLLLSAALVTGQAPAKPLPTVPSFTANFQAAQVPAAPTPPAAPEAPKEPTGLANDTLFPNGGNFGQRLRRIYYDEWMGTGPAEDDAEKPRRALPAPFGSPPFPSAEYQGYPLIGVPPNDSVGPVMKAIYGANTDWSNAIKDSRITFNGWVNTSGNWSTSKSSNVPMTYWIVPNSFQLDQTVFKLERQADTVQQDHIDWGFRSVALYGMDYRYMTAGGWGSDQLLKHNHLYGWDPTEQYVNVFIPGFLGGTDIRVGRWIACPDIETQYAPDNYMGSHSLLFSYDTYTQTGIMVSQKINDQLMIQAALHAGTDMAPWYPGATPTAAFGYRWVSKDNNDAFYTWVNALNNAHFRNFTVDGQPLGHDNFNYLVTTWQHRFNKFIHTKTEFYYMWQFDAERGGTPSAGPTQPFGGGGGDGVVMPGISRTYGLLNYTTFQVTDKTAATVRNEVVRDERGARTGTPGTYTSHTFGISYTPNSVYQIRPEVGYYRNYDNRAFDNGTRYGNWVYGFDMTMKF